MSALAHLSPVRAAFHGVVRAVVPAASELDLAGWARLDAIVDRALDDRPAAVRRQLRVFLRILSVLSFLRHGRPLTALDPGRARALLGRLEGGRLLPLRRGVWGLRTLAFMGFYGQAEQRRRVGYAAEPGGWEARGCSAGPWPEREGAAPPEEGVLTAPSTGEGGRAGGPSSAGEGGGPARPTPPPDGPHG